MPLDVAKIRKLLAACEFKPLFIEDLGWNRHDARLEVPIDGQAFTLAAVAEKCGMAAFVCGPGATGRIPDHPTRRKIERQVAKSAHEHLIIYTDGKRTAQLWQWVRREPGKPAACREHVYRAGQPGDSLIQKLQALAVSLEEEEDLTLPDVTGRARRAFDVERVTKKFYDRFKTEHAAFLKFLEGIPDDEMELWYVSVMLNRLMFIYFVQKKGFLDNDRDYLRNKLTQCRKEIGKDRYYRDFLCPLFFEGFAKRSDDRSAKTKKFLGEVPYLNGGIFMPHQVEQICGRAISIPDKAFEKLFEFFDAYQWHLDERPLKRDNEINPDVLGYIFEKYINQKQMGAYYTREDITGYISANTVVPSLFDAAREKCKVAFEGERSAWRLLRDDPDRYIYPAISHGIVWDARQVPPKRLEQPFVLPPDIAAGISDVSKRTGWNKPAPADYALPTETWREVVARRKRYEEVRGKLAAGEARSINDLITYNLDIRQFAQDVIENCEGPELLVAFWKAIENVTVLDPTCGSGAFLFAALNILQPLYEACLERMRFFLEEWGDAGKKNHPNYHKLFTETLKRVEDHPNHRYFVLKSAIVNNLYGVDIMEEAVEICKLRLFLKLVAQIDRVDDLEPLPDIDFNIRAGNTLVGFTSLDEVRKTQEGTLGFGMGEVARIEEEADIADRAFRKFREMQTERGMKPSDFAEAKANLRSRLRKLTDELDRFLAGEYGVDTKKKDIFEKWRKSHQPFHWFAEFYGILKAGGFDIIMGNPPYLDLKDLRDYTVKGYTTISTRNLYSLILERCQRLVPERGRQGYIVPVSSVATEGYLELQQILTRRKLWFSSYDDRPSHLFEGLDKNTLSILLLSADAPELDAHSTRLCRWSATERDHLFAMHRYFQTPKPRLLGCLPKIGTLLEREIWDKMFAADKPLAASYVSGSRFVGYYSRKVNAFLQVLDFVPKVRDGRGRVRPPSEFKELRLATRDAAAAVFCCYNSTLFRWFMDVVSDGSHVNRREVDNFPFDPVRAASERHELIPLAVRLSDNLQSTAEQRVMRYEHDTLTVQCIIPKLSKLIIDEIDRLLAKHYGLTDEELDFIINYDIKYRVGQDSDGPEGE